VKLIALKSGKKIIFMDPEYPYPYSQNLAIGLYLNQLNPVHVLFTGSIVIIYTP
jgi:hypothetical protein